MCDKELEWETSNSTFLQGNAVFCVVHIQLNCYSHTDYPEPEYSETLVPNLISQPYS